MVARVRPMCLLCIHKESLGNVLQVEGTFSPHPRRARACAGFSRLAALAGSVAHGDVLPQHPPPLPPVLQTELSRQRI